MGKIGLRVKICLWLLVPAGVVSLIFGLLHLARQGKPPTLAESILLMVISVGATAVITWIFSRRVAHEEVRRTAARAVMLIQNTEKDAAALLEKAVRERQEACKDLGAQPESKKMIERCFDWIIYSLERLKGRISDARDDWRDFLPEEFASQQDLEAKERKLRTQRDAHAQQLEKMLTAAGLKTKEVRELAEKLENLEQRLGVIEATPSPITGAPREAAVPDAKYWFRRGLLRQGRGQYREAVQAYDKAIELREDYPEAWYSKGNAFNRLGRYEEAIKCYDKAIEVGEDFSEAWVKKGTLLAHLGRYKEAVQCHDKALELEKDNPRIWISKSHAVIRLGHIEQNLELIREAIECCEKGLKLTMGKDTTAWFNKACAFALLGQKGDMLEALKGAITLDAEYKDKAQKDQDFKAYWEDEDFKAVVE